MLTSDDSKGKGRITGIIICMLFVCRYRAREFYEKNNELRQALDQIRNGFFSPENPELFHDVVNSLLCDNGDQYVRSHRIHF